MAGAATLAIREYGPEVLGLLVAVLRDRDEAAEVFGSFCEDLWAGLPRFRWESSMRTWAYTLARHAAHGLRRDPHRRRRVPLSQHPEIAELEAHVRTTTVTYLRSEVKDRVSRLRESLDPDDQMLLVLRIDRQMSWTEIALVMKDKGEGARDVAAIDLTRSAAMHRKRFERVKDRLRALVNRENVTEDALSNRCQV